MNNIEWIGKMIDGTYCAETEVGYYFEGTNEHAVFFMSMRELENFLSNHKAIKCGCYECN